MGFSTKISFEKLYEIGFYKNPPRTYMDIGDEIGFFRREGKQRVQNYSSQLSKKDLDYAYDQYINNPAIKVHELDEVGDTSLYVLKTKRCTNYNRYIVYLYDPITLQMYERVARKIKKMKDLNFYTYVDFYPHKIDVKKNLNNNQEN